MRVSSTLVLGLVCSYGFGQAGYEAEIYLMGGASGGYAAVDSAGSSYMATPITDGFIVTKVDTAGGPLWSKRFMDEFLFDRPIALIDEEVVVASNRDGDMRVRRISADGVVIWVSELDRLGLNNGGGAIGIDHDQIVLTGRVFEPEFGSDVLLARLDSDGGLMNAASFGGVTDEQSLGMIVLSDGGVLVLGTYGVFPDVHAMVTRVGSSNDVLWSRAFDFGVWSRASVAIEDTSTGNLVVLGGTGPYLTGTYRGFVLALSSDGGILWTRVLHDSGLMGGVVKRANGRFCLGTTLQGNSTPHGSSDIVVLEFDMNGSMGANKCYGNEEAQSLISLVQVPSGGLFLTAASSGTSVYMNRQTGPNLDELCTGVSFPVAWQSLEPAITDVKLGSRNEANTELVTAPVAYAQAERNFVCCPYPVEASFTAEPTDVPGLWHFHSTSLGYGTLQWSFGGDAADVEIELGSNAVFEACLTITGLCASNTTCQEIITSPLSLGAPVWSDVAISLGMDAGVVVVRTTSTIEQLDLFTVDGRLLRRDRGSSSAEEIIRIDDIAVGCYIIRVVDSDGRIGGRRFSCQ